MSDTLIIALIVVGAAVGLLVWWARRRVGAVFGLEHVHGFVERIDSLRAAALDRFGEPLRDGDPRTAVTRAGLAVAYTIVDEGDRYRHHLSVGHPGGPTTPAVGARFLLLGVERLRVVDAMEVGLGVSPSGVHHAAWLLDAEQQALFVDQRPAPLDESALGTLFAKCHDEAARVTFEPLELEMGAG